MKHAWPACLLAAWLAATAHAEEAKRIEDNSFLIEEAYNQEEGVVQHILAVLYDRRSHEWLAAFTQEWPLGSQDHQLSYTLPMVRSGDPLRTGLGDVALNYRYQLARGERVAISPRVSLVFGTGDYKAGRGNGATGLELQLPVSVVLTDSVVAHLNVGARHTPRARATDGTRTTLDSQWVGGSLIHLTTPTFNWMLEVLTTRDEQSEGEGRKSRERTTLVSPGLRRAFNHASGAQTVVGLAAPMGVGSGPRTRGVFAYFSFEHPFL
jgi:hypothetical protein